MFKILQRIVRLFMHKEPYSSLYKMLGFYPNNIHLYELAFLHKSSTITNDEGRSANNERLEFLGDAVLDAIVAAILYEHFAYKKEGFLTNTRSKIVKRDSLNSIATQLGLEKMVVCSSKPVTHNNHLYGNALEALIGAVYLDQGYDVCFKFVKEKIIDKYINLEEVAKKEINFKSVLLEWSQKHKIEVAFNLIESFVDNDGNPIFQTEIVIAGVQVGVGIGFSKKESHQNAAKMAVKKIRTDKEFKEHLKAFKAAKNEAATVTEELSDIIDENVVDESENIEITQQEPKEEN